MTNAAIPEGFALIEPFGQFHELIGPLYGKVDGETFRVGMRMEEKHGNRGRNLHGGALAALVDSAMTWTCSLKRKPGYASVTTSLAVEMMSTARPGDWVEVEVDVMRAGGRVFFLNAFVKKGEERIARASATFQIVERPGTKREG